MFLSLLFHFFFLSSPFSIKLIVFFLHPSEQLVLYIRTNCSQVLKFFKNPYPNEATFLKFWMQNSNRKVFIPLNTSAL